VYFFQVKNLTPNQAAAQAIQLFSQEAKLCDAQPTKVARTQLGLRNKSKNERSNDSNSRLGQSKILSACNVPEPESGIPKNSKLDGQVTTDSSQGKLSLKTLGLCNFIKEVSLKGLFFKSKPLHLAAVLLHLHLRIAQATVPSCSMILQFCDRRTSF
jgi:ubiquitin-protein ligase E3 A